MSALVIGCAAGTLAAVSRWRVVDVAVSVISTLGVNAHGWGHIRDVAAHMVMPVFCLAAYYLFRDLRASVLEVAGLDFVRTARPNGVSRLRTVLSHVVPNALLPIVTMSVLQFGTLLSGSVAIETVFSWPGLGQLALDAVSSRDLNLLLGILFVSSLRC